MLARTTNFDRYHTPSAQWRPPVEILLPRIKRLRRRYGEGLGRRPSREESASMMRCARLRTIADYALDPTSGAGAIDITRLQNAAARAEAAMIALMGKKSPVHREPDHDHEAAHIDRLIT